MPKDILVIDQEVYKEGIKLLFEEFQRLYILQVADGLKTLLDMDVPAGDLIRYLESLRDIGFLSISKDNYYIINKRWIGGYVSKIRIDKLNLLKDRFKEVREKLKEVMLE